MMPLVSASVIFADCHSVQREGGIVLSTDILWAQPVAEIQDIKELYAEFVHIDVAVLQVILLPVTDCLFEC